MPKIKIIIVAAALIACIGAASPAVAQDAPLSQDVQFTQCGNPDIPSYTANYTVKPDTYDIYARLGRAEQAAPATLYFQPFGSSSCQTLGSATITGSQWTKIATLQETLQDNFSTFTLESGGIDSLPDANRPTIMLVSQTNPVCQPSAECTVTVDGRQGVVRPTGTLLNEDSLHVVTVSDPATDSVKRVDYYVDGKPAYSKTVFEPFNLRYVGSGEHVLSTVITYNSGQRVIFTESVDQGLTEELSHLFFNFVYGQSTPLKIIGVLCMLLAITAITLAIIRRVHRRRLWQKHHFFEQSATPTAPHTDANLPPTAAPLHIEKPDSMLLKTTKWVIPVVAIIAAAMALIIILNAFVVQLFAVDGPSMNSTLATGQQLVVDKLPQTWAHITGKDYIPKRGDIIVFKRAINPMYGDLGEDAGYVVKRVIGLPGERVTVKSGVVTVYNNEHPEGFNPDVPSKWEATYHPSDNDNIDITVEPGQVFVMGDNRPESVDSRANGPIKSENIVGKVEWRLSPWSNL